jgi:hypothetical protein
MSDQALVLYGQTIWGANFKSNPKTDRRKAVNAILFGFQADHSTRLQSMKLVDHITLNFNINMLTAAVILPWIGGFDGDSISKGL